MILDKKLVLSEAQAVTASAASTDAVDLLTNRDVGVGETMWCVIQVDEDAAAVGAATVAFKLETDTASDFSSAVALHDSGDIGKATLVKGYRYAFPLPRGTKRYLRVYYTVTNGPLTAGKFTAAIVRDVPSEQRYPQGQRVFG